MGVCFAISGEPSATPSVTVRDPCFASPWHGPEVPAPVGDVRRIPGNANRSP